MLDSVLRRPGLYTARATPIEGPHPAAGSLGRGLRWSGERTAMVCETFSPVEDMGPRGCEQITTEYTVSR